MKKYDIIIVGAGIGGLHAALSLQSRNPQLRTVIVEQNDYPGGYVSGFTIDGFYFDAAAETILGYEQNPSRKALEEFNFEHPFHLVEPMETYYSQGQVLRMFSNEEQFLHELEKVHPDQVAGVQQLIATSHQIRKAIHQLKLDEKITFGRILRMLFRYPVLRKYVLKDYRQLLDDFITDEDVKDYFRLFSLWFGLKFEDLKAPMMAYIISIAFSEGLYYPKGGMGAFAQKLAEKFLSLGGEIRYKSTVKKIIIENKTVKGVLLSSGETLESEYIIANSDLHRTVFDYIGEKFLPKRFTKQIRRLETSISGVLLFLGLEGYDLSTYQPHMMFGRAKDITKNYEEEEFNVDGIAVRIPNYDMLETNGTKKNSLIVLSFAPYNWNNFWKTGSRKRTKEYRELKKTVTEKIIERLEHFMPNISKHIKLKRLATPLTFDRFNNSTNGAWYGPKVNQKLPSFKSPIKNLYFAGSNVGGAGVLSAISSGLKTADYLFKRMTKK